MTVALLPDPLWDLVAVYGGDQTEPNPTHRAKPGSKGHLICDGRFVPLAVRLTGTNRNESQEALALVDAIPPRTANAGGRGIWLAMRRTEHGSGLGRWRWAVEPTLAG